MSRERYTITASRYGSTEREDWDIEYRITYLYTPAPSARANAWGDYLDPPAGPDLDFLCATHEDGKGVEYSDEEWCRDWFYDHLDEAIAHAEEIRQGRADDHADFLRRQRIDDRITGDR